MTTKKIIELMTEVCQESLNPSSYNDFERIVNELVNTRSDLQE